MATAPLPDEPSRWPSSRYFFLSLLYPSLHIRIHLSDTSESIPATSGLRMRPPLETICPLCITELHSPRSVCPSSAWHRDGLCVHPSPTPPKVPNACVSAPILSSHPILYHSPTRLAVASARTHLQLPLLSSGSCWFFSRHIETTLGDIRAHQVLALHVPRPQVSLSFLPLS